MAINPDQDVSQTIVMSSSKTVKKQLNTSVTIMPDPDGTGRMVRIDVTFADGNVGTSYQQFKDIGTAAQRNTVKDFIQLCHVLGAQAAGFS
jgi:hypothetical protein